MSADDRPSIINPGSSGITLTGREEEIASMLSMGFSQKKIANLLGLHPGTVSAHVSRIASRIPGNGSASMKIAVWYLEHRD